MGMQQSLSGCVKALAELQLLVNSKRWHAIPKSEEMFNNAFAQLRKDMAGGVSDVNDQQSVKLLEQQVRRIQREMRRGMYDINEKLDWLATEQRRTQHQYQQLGLSTQD
jgi:TRAP-type mannitol/chloroaromatic compound transport system substrate-binding protein